MCTRTIYHFARDALSIHMKILVIEDMFGPSKVPGGGLYHIRTNVSVSVHNIHKGDVLVSSSV